MLVDIWLVFKGGVHPCRAFSLCREGRQALLELKTCITVTPALGAVGPEHRLSPSRVEYWAHSSLLCYFSGGLIQQGRGWGMSVTSVVCRVGPGDGAHTSLVVHSQPGPWG